VTASTTLDNDTGLYDYSLTIDLSEGAGQSVYIEEIDNAGNTSGLVLLDTYTVDKAPPVIALIAPAVGTTTDAQITVSGTITDAIVTDPQNFKDPFSRLLGAVGVSEPTVTAKPRPPRPKPSPPPSPELGYFKDITVTGIDSDKLYKPDPKKELYNVYFTLSAQPPREWVQIFEAERRFPRHTMWRHAWIEGHYIGVNCCLDEVKKYHSNDIKQDVVNTNQKYREYLQQQAIKEQKQMLKEEEEKREIKDALEGLDFD